MTAEPSGRRAAGDVLAQVVGRVANLALGVAVTLVLVRSLGEGGFGRWATVLAVTQIAGYLGELGLERAAVRRAAADRGHEAEWTGALLAVRIALAVPATLAALTAVLLLADGRDMRVAGALVCATILLYVPSALRMTFQLRTRNDVPVAVMTVNSLLWGGAAIAIAALGGGLVAFAVAFVAAEFLTAALLAGLALRLQRVSVRGVGDRVRDLARVGVPLGVGALLTLAYGKVDQVMVFHISGEREAGLYGAVYRLLDQAQLVPIAVMTTMLPLLSAAHPVDPARTRRLLQIALDLLAVASLPVLAFTIVEAEALVTALFGDAYADAAPALPVLMGAYVLISFGYVTGNMIVVLDLQKLFAVIALGGLVLNVALNALLIPRYGFVAAAWTTVATELIVLGLVGWAVLRRLGYVPSAGRLARTVVAATLLGAAVVAGREAGIPLGGLVVLAMVVYAALVAALRILTLAELRGLVRREVA